MLFSVYGWKFSVREGSVQLLQSMKVPAEEFSPMNTTLSLTCALRSVRLPACPTFACGARCGGCCCLPASGIQICSAYLEIPRRRAFSEVLSLVNSCGDPQGEFSTFDLVAGIKSYYIWYWSHWDSEKASKDPPRCVCPINARKCFYTALISLPSFPSLMIFTPHNATNLWQTS